MLVAACIFGFTAVILLGASTTLFATYATASSEFLKPMRRYLMVRSFLASRYTGWLWNFLADLMNCGYCSAWWHSVWATALTAFAWGVWPYGLLMWPGVIFLAIWLGRLERVKRVSRDKRSVQDMLSDLDDT